MKNLLVQKWIKKTVPLAVVAALGLTACSGDQQGTTNDGFAGIGGISGTTAAGVIGGVALVGLLLASDSSDASTTTATTTPTTTPPVQGDIDGDGIPDASDPDIDGDGIPNGDDNDVDGDGLNNGVDTDVDGDGIPNATDPDADADGVPNATDTTPNGSNDIDGDGIPDETDPDIDGDNIDNVADPVVYGDGTPNSTDPDVDGDGIPNTTDPDIDGDGAPNSTDPDVDGDGIDNDTDTDVDGDGIPNGSDPDVDGDGIPNSSDPDVDGDGIPNSTDDDIDGDGIPNATDPDSDGDGTTDNGNNTNNGGGPLPNLIPEVTLDGDGLFNTSLLPEDAIPASNSTNTGTANIDFDPATGGATGTVNLQGIDATQVDIMIGPPGTNGFVAVALEKIDINTWAIPADLDAAQTAIILQNLNTGNLYVNVSSAAFPHPTAELRKQIMPANVSMFTMTANDNGTAEGFVMLNNDTMEFSITYNTDGAPPLSTAHMHDAGGATVLTLTQRPSNPARFFFYGTMDASMIQMLQSSQYYFEAHLADGTTLLDAQID